MLIFEYRKYQACGKLALLLSGKNCIDRNSKYGVSIHPDIQCAGNCIHAKKILVGDIQSPWIIPY